MTVDQLKSLMPGGVDQAKWDELSQRIVAISEDEVSGLKNNEAVLKQEKIDALEKYRNEKDNWKKEKSDYEKQKSEWDKMFNDKKVEYEKKISELDKKIADNQPEQIRQLYEQRQSELKANYEEQQENLNKQIELMKTDYESNIAKKDKQLAELEKGVFQRDCLEQFNTAINGKNIDPTMLGITRSLILGDDYNKFSRRDIGSGNSIITRSDGKTIEASVAEFLSSDAGKRFMLNNSTGGGADGGTMQNAKTMSRATYESLSVREKQEALKKYTITS